VISVVPPPQLTSLPFPYTTLFRSGARQCYVARYAPDVAVFDILGIFVEFSVGADAATLDFLDALEGLQVDPVLVNDHALGVGARSEEHTSELQSRENLVCCLLLEK